MPEINCYVVSIFPVAKVYAETNNFLIASMILFIIIIITIFLLYWGILRDIIKPILQVSKFMEDHTENSNNRLDIHSYKEIDLLADRCNAMLDSIADESDKNLAMQSNVYEMQLALKQAQISALQSQINPHFLYNTLDCIKGFGYELNSSEIVDISSSLSSLLRYAIKGPDYVHVFDELNCIESYMSIINIRFSGRFKFTTDINPDTLDCLMPRFLLQPLIENSLYHGLESRPEGGKISLTVDWNENHSQLIFEVSDDGVGIPAETLQNINEKINHHSINQLTDENGGIGLFNIARRVQLTDPEHGVFRIDSIVGKYTKVHIELTPHQQEDLIKEGR